MLIYRPNPSRRHLLSGSLPLLPKCTNLNLSGREQSEQPAAGPGTGAGEAARPGPGEHHPAREQRTAACLSVRLGKGAPASRPSKRAQGPDRPAGDHAQERGRGTRGM